MSNGILLGRDLSLLAARSVGTVLHSASGRSRLERPRQARLLQYKS